MSWIQHSLNTHLNCITHETELRSCKLSASSSATPNFLFPTQNNKTFWGSEASARDIPVVCLQDFYKLKIVFRDSHCQIREKSLLCLFCFPFPFNTQHRSALLQQTPRAPNKKKPEHNNNIDFCFSYVQSVAIIVVREENRMWSLAHSTEATTLNVYLYWGAHQRMNIIVPEPKEGGASAWARPSEWCCRCWWSAECVCCAVVGIGDASHSKHIKIGLGESASGGRYHWIYSTNKHK